MGGTLGHQRLKNHSAMPAKSSWAMASLVTEFACGMAAAELRKKHIKYDV
jgi:hypothetical protein